MTPERWQHIESIFEAAIELSPEEREMFVSDRCAGDKDLEREIRKLLANDESAGTFIESPVWTDSSFLNSAAKNILSESLGDQIDDDNPEKYRGKRIGAYRIVEEIGRGGMGAVYLAERADGEFSQKVAIKLIKRGMDSDFIIRRFRHERQILASFEHPFIARLLDGGTTAENVPYFVMEYIDGQTLYLYCDKNRLSIRDRLKMFQKVCSALQYAHERQIIHRDIKPSNILINKYGSPKLLDFGIAKILDPDLVHESLNPTASLMRMMTPDYASPEQVQGLEVTPSSDIYSLGILLYELLTGHRPYNFAGHALHEVSRVVCEVLPEPPSLIIDKPENLLPQYSAAEPDRYADVRSGSPRSIREQLETNVDRIVLKAMAKDPAHRYASVKAFSEDISRHLKGEKISAPDVLTSPVPSRHATLPATANAKTLAVLPFRFLSLAAAPDTDDRFLGLGLADALITRLSKIRKFVVRPTSSILSFGDGPIDPMKAGAELQVDYIIDGNIKKAGDRLRVSVQLLNVEDNAAIWAASIDESLTDLFTLEDTISNKLIEGLLPELTGNDIEEYSKRGTESAEAFEHYLRGRYYFNTFTEDGLAKAFVEFHKAIAADPDYAHAYSGIADYYNWLGVIGVLPPQECFQPAIQAAKEALEIDENLSEAHASLGFSLHGGDYDWRGAEHHLRRAIELNPGNANAYVWYSIVLFTEGRFTDGLEFARRSVDLDPLTPFNHHNIGWGLYFARRYDDAAAQYEKVVSEFPNYGFGYYGLSKIHRVIGETEAALNENDKAMELMDNGIFSLLSEAECLAAAGQTEAAREKIDDLLRMAEDRYVSPYQLALAYCYLEDKAKALECLDQARESKDPWLNWMGVEPVFDLIRDEPPFRRIWEEIGYYGLFDITDRTPSAAASDPKTQEIGSRGVHDMTTLVIDPNEYTDGDTTASLPRRTNYARLAAIALAGLIGVGAIAGVAWRYSDTGTPRAVATFRNPSIVVLPFRSEDGASSDVGVGLADSLTGKLGNIKSLNVTSAASGRAVVDSDPETIGRQLNVAYLLRGKLSGPPNSPVLDVEFVNTSSGDVEWSDSMRAADGNLFKLQTALAERLWSAIGIEPLPLEIQQVKRSYTDSNIAYHHYLIGRYRMTTRSSEGLESAIMAFEAAAKEDGNFALPYVGLADAYALLNLYDIDPPADAYERSQKYALTALAIDEDLVDAHATLAYLRFFHERDRSGSELEFRRAIQVNPSYAQGRQWFALAMAAMNKPELAKEEIEAAKRLDPMSASVTSAAGLVAFYAGRFGDAIDECDRALALDPRFVPAHKVKRWTYIAAGDLPAAREAFRQELSYSGGDADQPGWTVIEAQISDPADGSALARLNTAAADPTIERNAYTFAYEVALAYNALGMPEKALDWLERSEAARSHGFNYIEVDPRLANLRSNARFQGLIKKLHS